VSYNLILRVVGKLTIPLVLLFALYVQFHGDFSPGGGFQAGVLFAAGLILYGLVFGAERARAVVPPGVVRVLMSTGVLIYAGVGVVGMLLGRNYLDYSVLGDTAAHGQHLGIALIELGVGISVAAVMLMIFYAFSGRER
jgi:multicomponent Na+:H+ antiporter subunit B